MLPGEYVSFPLNKLYPDKNLPAEIFLYIGGKFIKYIHAHDSIPKEKFDYLIKKRFQFLFVKYNDLLKFESWSEKAMLRHRDNIVKVVGKENTSAVEAHIKLENEIINFVTKEITKDDVKKLLSQTKSFIAEVKKRKLADQFLAQMMSFSKRTADHCTNVAHLSTYLALNLGYTGNQSLEDIYLGALLHDYGKTRISPKYLESPGSEQYKAAMRKHPSLGKTTLLLDSELSDEALRVIGEHHERFDGHGFPRGLKGSKIYELSKIVSIANAFDKLVLNGQGDLPQKQRKAIQTLEKDRGRHFDPKVLARCIRAMNEVVA